MKAYVATTGVMFALLVVVHVWRAIEEGPHLATDPAFVAVTAVAAAMSFWAWRVFQAMRS
jgi:hypothetical protein